MALQRTAVMLAAAPFGWISGWLSGIDRTYPFWLTSLLLVIGVVTTVVWWAGPHTEPSVEPVSADHA
jgi:VIT1/CCC1 family predicted Fe2+/Mn2+ transporter